MKGRPNKPIEQHEMEGTKRGDRHPGTALVLGGRNLPDTPKDFTPSQEKLWLAVLEVVAPILDMADVPMLENFVVIVDRLHEARKEIADYGLMIDELIYNKEGECVGSKRVANPAYRVEKDYLGAARQYAEQFGLTPSARARLGIAVAVARDTTSRVRDKVGENPLEMDDVLDHPERHT